jgi:cell division protein FtsL
MNVAVKAINQTTLLSNRFAVALFAKTQLVIIALIFAVLVSALGVVYVKDNNRRLLSELQTLQNLRSNLHIRWSQLLLEEGAWTAAARVQKIAGQKLNMILPVAKSIILITNGF